MNDEKTKYLNLLFDEPMQVARWMGFTKLTKLHNGWIRQMLYAKDDRTILAHRGSYKTTCLAIAIAFFMLLFPRKNVIFLRKTDDDVKEVIRLVAKIIRSEHYHYIAAQLYGRPVTLLHENAFELTLETFEGVGGSVQLLGIGSGGSLTGKHADWIITDDIVNLKDRVSRAERDRIKLIYNELQNVKNRGGRITNCGTPWHKEDAISQMPNVKQYSCYKTKLMSQADIASLRASMTPSLFAANYELQHIASEDALFSQAPIFMDSKLTKPERNALLRDGLAHIDASYGGKDGSALTLIKRRGQKVYVLGKLRKKHIDKCLPEYLTLIQAFMCGPVECELNADKGYLAKEIRAKGVMTRTYHENMNKYIKISSYLKKWWPNIVFHPDTDLEYINEILDYTIDAEHDDCPDSLASILRRIDRKSTDTSAKRRPVDVDEYDWQP